MPNKTLIAYFSQAGQNYVNGNIVNLPVGNTAVVAEKLKNLIDAELYRIEQAETYPEDYNQLIEAAKKELRENARPQLKVPAPDLSDRATLFLGYPNWWGTMPMPVWTFLANANIPGLKIAPFCTNEGSGMGRSEKDLAKLCPDAIILPGLPIIGHEAANSGEALKTWLKRLGFIQQLSNG